MKIILSLDKQRIYEARQLLDKLLGIDFDVVACLPPFFKETRMYEVSYVKNLKWNWDLQNPSINFHYKLLKLAAHMSRGFDYLLHLKSMDKYCKEFLESILHVFCRLVITMFVLHYLVKSTLLINEAQYKYLNSKRLALLLGLHIGILLTVALLYCPVFILEAISNKHLLVSSYLNIFSLAVTSLVFVYILLRLEYFKKLKTYTYELW